MKTLSVLFIFILLITNAFCWEQINLGTYDLYDVFFLNDTLGWITNHYNEVYKTTDGGELFDTVNTSYDYFEDIFFIDEDKGCIAGIPGDPPDMQVSNMHTTDGGENWTAGAWTSDLTDIFFVSESLGWSVLGFFDYGIYRTTNLGVSWDFFTPLSSAYYSVHFEDCEHGWLVGSDGNIIFSTDSGTTWTPQTSNTTDTLNSVFFLDINTGFACGYNGTVVKTTDGGNLWTVQTTNIIENLNKIIFLNSDTGWSVGDQGTIIYTTNGGSTWIEDSSGTYQTLRSVTIAGSTSVWAVGDNSTVLKKEIIASGIAQQDPVISTSNFKINYTPIIINGIIGFEIQAIEDGNLQINLYNTAGQNLGEIVHQRIYTGSNRFTINLQEKIGILPVGIYFMDIFTGEGLDLIRQPRKLMLLN